ncbi:hypothetical protein KCP74_18135 [Salmonella enterica subsp. enterica]|nr:hypothetical protein KCP74_18135 [Salmonella enterica subsp. enterica]
MGIPALMMGLTGDASKADHAATDRDRAVWGIDTCAIERSGRSRLNILLSRGQRPGSWGLPLQRTRAHEHAKAIPRTSVHLSNPLLCNSTVFTRYEKNVK